MKKKNHIKLLIAKNQLGAALQELLQLQSNGDELNNKVVLLSMTWHRFQKALIHGRFSWEEENRHLNHFAQRILKLLDYQEEWVFSS